MADLRNLLIQILTSVILYLVVFFSVAMFSLFLTRTPASLLTRPDEWSIEMMSCAFSSAVMLIAVILGNSVSKSLLRRFGAE